MSFANLRLGTLALVILITIAMAATGFATNGYFSHGYGTQAKGMAGVGAAFPQNSLAVATNPAGLVYVGNRYDIGFALFSPDREYTVTGNPSMMDGTFGLMPQTVRSDGRSFVIPNLGANWLVNPQTSVGISVFGNGGMNTQWPDMVFYGADPTGVDLSQMFIAGSVARELAPGHSLGISGIYAIQWFEAEGLQAFGAFSSDAAALTNSARDNATGFGVRLGYLGQLTPALRVGGSFKTKVYMSEFDSYAGLFAESGDFDVPASWDLGIAVAATPKLTLAADVQQILYSDIKSVGTPFNPADFMAGKLLGSTDGPGFGWEDVLTVKFGAQYQARPDLALRAGYSFGEQPIPETEVMFNILAPGVVEHHLTAGLTKKVGGTEISFAIMHALSKRVSGPHLMEVPGQQEIELKMHEWEFEIGLGF